MNKSEEHQRIQTICLSILTAIAVTGALFFFKPLLLPFVLAVFFTYTLTPIIDFQMKFCKFPRGVALLTTALLGCVVLFLIAILISASVNQITENADIYQNQAKLLLQKTMNSVPLEQFGIEQENLKQTVIKNSENTIRGLLGGLVGALMNILSNGILVFVFVLFMLIGKRKAAATGLLGEVETKVNRYLAAMVLVSGTTGLLVGLTLTFLGVDFAFVFGVLTFLLNFIPSIGSIIATLLPLPIAFLSPELSLPAKVCVIVIPGLIQFGIGNILTPKIMGDSLKLHPIVILLALIFFGMIWGIVGMFLATPLTAIMKIFFDRIGFTRPVARLLGGNLEDIN